MKRATLATLFTTAASFLGGDRAEAQSLTKPPHWRVAFLQIDDYAYAYVNGKYQGTVKYGQNNPGAGIRPGVGVVDLWPAISANGHYDVYLKFENLKNTYSYSYALQVDNRTTGIHGQCSTVPTCDNGSQRTGIVGEKHIEIDYYSIPESFQILKQPTPFSCWAAAAAMMLSWKDHKAYLPREAAKKATLQSAPSGRVDFEQIFQYNDPANGGLDPSQLVKFYKALGMAREPVNSYTFSRDLGLKSMLQKNGPLWIQSYDPKHKTLHAVVMFAISGDGSAAGTMVSYADPFDGVQHSESLGAVRNKYYDPSDSKPTVIHFTNN